jgi:hypothetical protein
VAALTAGAVAMFSTQTDTMREPTHVLRCSFCNKSQSEVRKLIAGSTSNICDECVEVCNDVLSRDPARQDAAAAGDVAADTPIRCGLCMIAIPASTGLLVENRGVLCPDCVDAIEWAAARRGTLEE